MDFGMPTLIELKSLEACVALCKENGLQFVEINMNLPEYQADRINADAFAEILLSRKNAKLPSGA